MPAVKFTDSFVRSLKYEGEQEDYMDSASLGSPGQLGIRVSRTTKTWFVRYRAGRKRRRRHIGLYPAMSLSSARSEAAKILNLAYSGDDPQAAAENFKKSPEFKDLWPAYIRELERKDKQRAKAGKRLRAERSVQEDKSRFDKKFVPQLGDLKVQEITRRHISTLLERIADKTPVEANRCHTVLGQLFKRALNLGWIEHSPMYGMDKPSIEIPRDRFLSRDEIRLVWDALENLPINQRDIFKLLFLTAQRSGEVMSMKWEDVNLETGEWNQTHNKSGRPHIVFLSPQAVRVLEARLKEEYYTKKMLWMLDSEWVFPSVYNRGRIGCKNIQHTTSVKKGHSLLQGVDIPHWTPHDIRRTSRTLMSEIGIPEEICEIVLNHSIKGLAGVYNKNTFLKEKRHALEKLGREIDRITGAEPTRQANVIQLRRAL